MYGPYPGVVIDWRDGDTCHLDLDLGFGIFLRAPISCRILAINAPELHTEAGKVACEYAISICPPQTRVTALSHGWDKYGGRFDGQLILPDGSDFGQLMLESGHAVPLPG